MTSVRSSVRVFVTRQPLPDEAKLGPTPASPLTEAEHDKNNLPDALTRWAQRDSSEKSRPRTAQSFCVPKADITEQGYDLSVNRYKEVGWWRTRPALERYNLPARYSLVVSIRTPQTEVDLYNAVANQVVIAT